MKNLNETEEKLPKIDEVTNYILKKGSLVTYIVKTENDGMGIVKDTLTRDLTFSENWLNKIVDDPFSDRGNFYFFDHLNPDIIDQQMVGTSVGLTMGINSEDVEIEKISRKEYENKYLQMDHWFNYFQENFQEMNSLGVS